MVHVSPRLQSDVDEAEDAELRNLKLFYRPNARTMKRVVNVAGALLRVRPSCPPLTNEANLHCSDTSLQPKP